MDDFSIYDELIDPVIILDQNKKVVYANLAIQQFFDLTLRKLKSVHQIGNLITFNEPKTYLNPNIPLSSENDGIQIETAYKTLDGAEGHFLVITKKLNEELTINFLKDMSLEIKLHKKYHLKLEENQKVLIALKQAKEQLEIYNKNLEHQVAKRTSDLKRSNQYLNTMANSLGQALLMFNKEGTCLPVYTKAVEKIFGRSPKDLNITDVLKLNTEQVKTFKDWSSVTFDEMIPFKDTIQLSLNELNIVDDSYETEEEKLRRIKLEYFPVRDPNKKILYIVLVGTDITDEYKTSLKLNENKKYVSMILKVIENKEHFISSIVDIYKLLENVDRDIKHFNDNEKRLNVLRDLHSIKGVCGLFDINIIESLVHEIEVKINDYIKEYELGFPPNIIEEIEMNIEDLTNEYKNFISSMKSLVGNNIESGTQAREITIDNINRFQQMLHDLEGNNLLKKQFKQDFCLTPVNLFFKGHQLLLNKLAFKLGKKLSPFEIIGGDVRVDEKKHQDLFNVMIHLFRNCIGHGIEKPEERIKIGKPPEGKILFEIIHDEERKLLIFNLSDDGRGINVDILKNKANELNIRLEDNITDEDILSLIFHPKFSTADKVTEVSGQGMGMNAVSETIKEKGGTINVYTLPNEGTTFTISVPF